MKLLSLRVWSEPEAAEPAVEIRQFGSILISPDMSIMADLRVR